MESDVELALRAGDLIWPLILAGAAAFTYLALLAYEHLKVRALVDALAAAAGRRREREMLGRAGAPDPLLERTRAFEDGLREILAREGLRGKL